MNRSWSSELQNNMDSSVRAKWQWASFDPTPSSGEDACLLNLRSCFGDRDSCRQYLKGNTGLLILNLNFLP